jgi:molecular chaperone DnaK (HSP70)
MTDSTAKTAMTSLIFLVPVLAALAAAAGFRGHDVILGLDIGTTFSTIAVKEDGAVRVLKLEGGREACWSAVGVVGGTFVVGEPARRLARSHPAEVVFNSKRVIGRTINDSMVRSEAVRHGGRLMEHPASRRSPAQGKLGKGACPTCVPDLAFALPLWTQTAAERQKLARHRCVDGGSLVDTRAGGPVPPPLGALAAGPAAAGGGARHYLLLTPHATTCLIADHLLSAVRAAVSSSRRFKAMACVPAEFSHAQRQATLDGLERAGVTVVRTLHEPTAAALAYGLHRDAAVHYVVVYDMGGGTLDVSVLFASGSSGSAAGRGSFTVIGSAGDNALGGEDVDDCVVGLLQEQLRGRQCGVERLKGLAEGIKIVLSGNGGVGAAESVLWSCEGGVGVRPGGASGAGGELTRGELETGCSALWERALEPVITALEGAAVAPELVDEVVLVGGSTRLPKVQERLSAFFGGRALRNTVDPDLAVAMGAAAAGD